eukprot:scaffold222112_cov90-Attheya_sp.AAC.1
MEKNRRGVGKKEDKSGRKKKRSSAMECRGTMKQIYGQFKGISDIDLQAAKRNVLNQEKKAT